jgi:hypothetical protein
MRGASASSPLPARSRMFPTSVTHNCRTREHPSSAGRGGHRNSFSRRDARPSFAVQRVNDSLSTIASRLKPAVGPASARSCSAHVARIERQRNPGWAFQAFRSSPGFTEPVTGPATSGRTRWFNPGYNNNKSGRRNAARRMSSDGPHRRQVYAVCANHLLRARLALNAARSPDGVPQRYLRPRTNAAAQLQNALPGTWHPPGVT